jgi:D-alanyl-D-alanine carboxypeptidase
MSSLCDEAIHLEEGSGISLGNHFTARGLAKVLDLFAPHKTGTLEGVRTLAGYAETFSHGRVCFVICTGSMSQSNPDCSGAAKGAVFAAVQSSRNHRASFHPPALPDS